jgi:hypothetical protein
LGKKLGCNYACNWKRISNPTPLATGKNIPVATTVATELCNWKNITVTTLIATRKKAQLQKRLQLEKSTVPTPLATEKNLSCNPACN